MRTEIRVCHELEIHIDADEGGRADYYNDLITEAHDKAASTGKPIGRFLPASTVGVYGVVGWDYGDLTRWIEHVSSVLARQYCLTWRSCTYDGIVLSLTTDNDPRIFDAYIRDLRTALEPVKRWITNWET